MSAQDESLIDVDEEEDEDEPIDEEQLNDYNGMIKKLGSFPDKVLINSLSIVAEDYVDEAKNARTIYDCIKRPLVDPRVSRDHKLPLVYVIDSILKNVKGVYSKIIEEDAKNWIPVVFDVLSTEQRTKLEKVWKLWRPLFAETSWKEMGSPFLTNAGVARLAAVTTSAPVAGIPLLADGTLQLKPLIRRHMQAELDEAQQDVTNELEKVSLERLAQINPDLLEKLKENAEAMVENEQGTNRGASKQQRHRLGNGSDTSSTANFSKFETRTTEWIERTAAWDQLNFDYETEVPRFCTKVDGMVQGISLDDRYTQEEALQTTHSFAAAAVAAQHAKRALESMRVVVNKSSSAKSQSKSETNPSSLRSNGQSAGQYTPSVISVDKSLFTNDGVKKKDSRVVGSLYEIGLPFVSTADGRRFATQMEHSKHLDFLFKKNQLEKSMARTEERGWYPMDEAWTGETRMNDSTSVGDTTTATMSTTASALSSDVDNDDRDPNCYKVPADESRDPCVVCGINFKMELDNEEGIFKFINCREIDVLQDDVAEEESESKLAHVTCWRGLGKPEWLTMDQALQSKRS